MLNMPLKCFFAVAERGSFTGAAKSLSVTQPTVSKYVASLEAAWGFPLFNRTSRHVELTPQGELLHGILKEALGAWNDGLARARLMERNLAGHLRVGIPAGFYIERMPLFETFRRRYPKVQLTVQKFGYHELEDQLSNGRLDIILQICPDDKLLQNPALQRMLAFHSPTIIRLSRTHPLASKARTIEDLGDLDAFAFNEEGHPITPGILQRLVQDKKWKLNLVTSPNVESIRAAVDLHLGCSFTSPFSCALDDDKTYRYFDADDGVDMVFTWNTAKNTEVVDAFLEIVRFGPLESIVILD